MARNKIFIPIWGIIIGMFFFNLKRAEAQVKYKFLVYFTDKINSPYSINSPEKFLSSRSIQRRNKQSIPIVNNDLPVNSAYTDSLKKKGVEVWYTSRWFNAAVINADSGQLSSLNKLPFVKNIHRVGRIGGVHSVNPGEEYLLGPAQINTNYGASLNQVSMIGADAMHTEGYRGEGKLIAILDGGFLNANAVPFLDSLYKNKQILHTYDFVNRNENVYVSIDHGTSVLSVMGGYSEGSLIGTAYKANYILLRTEDDDTEKLIEEANWLIGAEYADSAGADLINSSLGYTTFDDPSMNHSYQDLNGNTTLITMAADMAASKGIVVINSAGNDGASAWKHIAAPADADSILAVGAVDGSGNYASFSSIGPSYDGRVKPDVVAQGQNTIVGRANGSIVANNGTSFSGPLVCGMVAGFWQANPNLTNMQVIDYIRKSGSIYSNPNEKLGYGIPNYVRAKTISAVQEKDQNEFKIIYNQEGKFYIVSNANFVGKTFTITVIDLLGRIVNTKSVNFQSERTEISYQPEILPGLYLINIEGEGVSENLKYFRGY